VVSAIAHVSLGTDDIARARAFYDAVLSTLGIRVLMSSPHSVGYGRSRAEFWIGVPHDGHRASAGNGTHVCFTAGSIEEVQSFHAVALAQGATDDGPPGLRPQYSAGYYAAFVRDPDGHKIEAVVMLGSSA